MGKLSAFKTVQQMSLDSVLAELRDASPPEVTAAVEKGASGAMAGTDPDVIIADLELQGDVSQVKIGIEPHDDGDCPYTQRCEVRRRLLPTYRPFQPCHWRAWGDWPRCSIYRNAGNGREPRV